MTRTTSPTPAHPSLPARPAHPARPARRRGPFAGALTAVAALGAGLLVALVPASAGAHEGHGSAAAEATCPPALAALLQGAGDNFALGCTLPEPVGDPTDLLALQAPANEADLEPGQQASQDMALVANIPKQGPFAGEQAYGTDLAFKGTFAFGGNYDGFTVYDIAQPTRPRVVTQVVCPGSQNDVSVWKDLLVLSVDSSRSDDSCSSTAQSASQKSSWEGLRVFDISDPTAPQYVASVETPCGSHTHTLAPTKDGRDLFVYVSSYSPNATFPDCQPPHDRISVVEVPGRSPQDARLVSTPVLFPDGGNPGNPVGTPVQPAYSATSGCHDITAFPSKDLAAGACMGDGILLDISDRAAPKVTAVARDTRNFAFWHSATFSNDGDKVVFTDELGGGGAPTCNPATGSKRGADGIYDVVDGQLQLRSYWKIPRTQSDTENCVAHNGSLIPVEGRDIMVQAWYQGGISVVDFTDSRKPREIAWFDRGPLSADELRLGGSWSAYWYRGHVYSNDIQQGLDVLTITDPAVRKVRRYRGEEFNPQSQPSYNG